MRTEIDIAAGARYRKLGLVPRIIIVIFTTVCVGAAIIYLFSILVLGQTMLVYGYLNILQAMMVPTAFLLFPAHAGARNRLPWYDVILAFLSFALPLTFFVKAADISFKAWEIDAPFWAFVLALVYWPLVVESCRRAGGLFLAVFILVVSIYPLFGDLAPGILKANSLSLYRLTNYHIFSSESVNGLVIGVIGKLFIGFLVFGVVLMNTGAGKPFLGVALSALGRVRGGAAKVAVGGSALVASISGSAVTNVLTIGPVTIPLMKRTGYPAHYAAAIETCTSTGGVLFPPVMGTVAFLMASVLNISYLAVCLAALVPILLYYLGLFIQVDGYAARAGIKGLPRNEIPPLSKSLRDMAPYAVALVLLIWLLLILRREAQAPFYVSAYLLAVAMLRKETRLRWSSVVRLFEDTGKLLAELITICLGIGFVAGSLFITGVAQSLTSALLSVAGGNTYLLILLGGIASFILGMGLTASACYLLLAILLAPALVKAGMDQVAVHLFLAYTGMLSYITPPVAIAAYAAAALAGTSGMKTGFQAVRLGMVIFIIPFFFVLNPAFILRGTPVEIVRAIVSGSLGVVMLASGIEGYLVGLGRLSLILRLTVLASGALVFLPYWPSQLAGAAIVLALVPLALRQRNRLLGKAATDVTAS